MWLEDLKKFIRDNYWILGIFIVTLLLIFYTKSGNLVEITLVFLAHFSADFLIMLMQDYFVKGKIKQSLFCQLFSFLIFFGIGLYAGLVWGKWVYLIPQLMFIWPLIKGFVELKGKKFFFSETFFIGWGITFIIFYFYFGLAKNIPSIIQLFGFVIFPIGLFYSNEKVRYFLSLVGIFLITLGSFFQLVIGFKLHHVSGVDISYTLLPLSVFIFYLKDFKKYLIK